MCGIEFPIDSRKKHQYKSNLVLNISNSDGKKLAIIIAKR